MFDVQALGALHVAFNGRSITFKMSKAAVLLVYLMRQPDVRHSREQLVTLLWPEESGKKARENFRQALYQLRRACGGSKLADEFFAITRTTVQFRADSPHTLDAHRFEQAVTDGDWETAVNLYQGEFLETFYPDEALQLDEWQAVTREYLHQFAVHSFTQLARQAEMDNPTHAAYAVRRLLELEPWAEEGHRLLMRISAGQGRRADALAQYQKCADILDEEFGTTPSPETITLYEQIENGRFTPTTSLTHNLPASLTPLVGRETEMEALQKQIARQECRLLTIVGQGGVGKTRLLLAAGWTAVQCPSTVPFEAVYFASLAELEATDAPHLPEHIARHLLQILDIHPPTTDDPHACRHALTQAWGNRSILLLLDNWEHLTAGATLLAEWLAAMPYLQIMTTSRMPLNLQGEWLFPLMGLDSAAPQGAMLLFRQCACRIQPHFELDATSIPLVKRICHALGGHPLALEMAAAWLQGLTLEEVAEGVAEGMDLLTSEQQNLPPRQRDMRHIARQSWEQLSSSQQEILAQLTLFRQPFTRAAAQAVSTASLTQLALLVSRFWLHRMADGSYQYHELLRHFAHEQLLTDSNLQETAVIHYVQYHLRWVSQSPPPTWEALRHHWADVEYSWKTAVSQQMWLELGESCTAITRFHEKMGTLSEGIAWLEQAAEQLRPHYTSSPALPILQRTLSNLLIAQASLRNTQVNSSPVPAIMQEASQIAQQLGDTSLWIEAQTGWVSGLIRLGHLAEAKERAERILAELPPFHPSLELAPLWGCLATISLDQGILKLGERYIRQQMEVYEQKGMIDDAAYTRHNLAIALCPLGQYEEAHRLLQMNLVFWRPYRTNLYLAMTREGLGYLYLQQGKLKAALNHLRAALRLYEQVDDLDGMAYTHLYLGHVAGKMGQWRKADKHYRESLRLRQTIQHTRLLCQCQVGLAQAAWQQGKMEAATTYLQSALPVLTAGQVEGEDVIYTYWAAYQILTTMGDPQATDVLDQGASYVRQQAAALADDPAALNSFVHGVAVHQSLLQAAGKADLL